MKAWFVPVTTVSVIIGALIAVQYRSQADARRLMPSRRVEDLVVMLKATEKGNLQLAEQVALLQGQALKGGAGSQIADDHTARYPSLTGPGMLVTVTERGHAAASPGMDEGGQDGTSAVLHGEDLLKIVNQLRTGGAEAVAVNGKRLTELSEVVTAGQHIVINKVAIAPPYRIVAIGPADDMKEALALTGGVVEVLTFYGIEVKSQPLKAVTVPAGSPPRAFKFAKPEVPVAVTP